MLAAWSCRTPTQILVDVRTTAACSEVTSTAIAVATPDEDFERKLPQASKEGCEREGVVGTVVLLPSGAEDAEVAVRVVTGLARRAEECAPPAYAGCIVARRQTRFVPGEVVRLVVTMSTACRDNPCGPGETCDDATGACVPSCASPPCGGGSGDAGGGDAGTDTGLDGGDGASGCEPACTGPGRSCDGDTCVVRCSDGGAPCTGVVCPPGVPCRVECSVDSACSGVSCGEATRCELRCTATDACKNGLDCASAQSCTVVCTPGSPGCATDIRCPRPVGSKCQLTCGQSGCGGNVVCCSQNECLVSGSIGGRSEPGGYCL